MKMMRGNQMRRLTIAALLALTFACATSVEAAPAHASSSSWAVATSCGGDGGNYGAQLLGGAWAGGFTGVPVYSNGADSAYDGGCQNSAITPSGKKVVTGTKWQCTELVNRLYATKGWISAPWPGYGGRSSLSARDSMYDMAPKSLSKEPNGSISHLDPGDVVSINVYKPSGAFEPDGHVLVVSAVSGSKITYVSQNAGTNTTATVTTTGTFGGGKLTVNPSGKWTYQVIGVVHAPAQSAGGWGSAEEVPGTAALNSRGDAGVFSVSCASAGNCSAGGFYDDSTKHLQAFVVNQVNGTWDNAEEVPATATLNTGGSAQVTSVSCPSAGNCTAGGDYEGRGYNYEVFVVSEVNGTWGSAEEIPGIAVLNAHHLANVNSLSCASAGNCSVGGWYTDSSDSNQAFVVSEANGVWGTAEEVPGTAALNTDGSALVNSMSCASPGNCSAVGFYTSTTSGSVGFVVSQANGTWGSAAAVPGEDAEVYDVSCVSAGNCIAGGSYWDGTQSQASVISQVNGTWGTPEGIPGAVALDTDGEAGVASMSCTSPGNCSASGWYENGSGNDQAFVVSQVDGTWGTAITLPGIGVSVYPDDTPVVSCGSAGNCSAAGYYGDSSSRVQAFVANQANGTWDTPEEVPGTATLNTGGDAEVNSVSCTSSTSCSAGGSYKANSGNQAFVVSQNPMNVGKSQET
jgi:CHAP domain